MRAKVEYYIIFTIEIYRDRYHKLKHIKPRVVKYPDFIVTEKKPEYEEISVYRKYVGILSPKKLKDFMEECMFDESNKTMGALTIEYGLIPAVSFSSDHYGYYFNAYISPIPHREDEQILISILETHPQPNMIRQRVGRKLYQCLDVLENTLNTGGIPSSFYVNVNQMSLPFMEENNASKSL